MALKDTIQKMKHALNEICADLEKSCDGNRAASQRVRTGSIKFSKLGKLYRKESIAAEKKGAKPAKKAAPKTASKAKPVAKKKKK